MVAIFPTIKKESAKLSQAETEEEKEWEGEKEREGGRKRRGEKRKRKRQKEKPLWDWVPNLRSTQAFGSKKQIAAELHPFSHCHAGTGAVGPPEKKWERWLSQLSL